MHSLDLSLVKMINKIHANILNQGYKVRLVNEYLETNNLLICCKEYKKITDTRVSTLMQKVFSEATSIEKYPILIIREVKKKPLVYYINSDGEIDSISYDTWRTQALPLEKEKISFSKKKKPEIPIYIG